MGSLFKISILVGLIILCGCPSSNKTLENHQVTTARNFTIPDHTQKVNTATNEVITKIPIQTNNEDHQAPRANQSHVVEIPPTQNRRHELFALSSCINEYNAERACFHSIGKDEGFAQCNEQKNKEEVENQIRELKEATALLDTTANIIGYLELENHRNNMKLIPKELLIDHLQSKQTPISLYQEVSKTLKPRYEKLETIQKQFENLFKKENINDQEHFNQKKAELLAKIEEYNQIDLSNLNDQLTENQISPLGIEGLKHIKELALNRSFDDPKWTDNQRSEEIEFQRNEIENQLSQITDLTNNNPSLSNTWEDYNSEVSKYDWIINAEDQIDIFKIASQADEHSLQNLTQNLKELSTNDQSQLDESVKSLMNNYQNLQAIKSQTSLGQSIANSLLKLPNYTTMDFMGHRTSSLKNQLEQQSPIEFLSGLSGLNQHEQNKSILSLAYAGNAMIRGENKEQLDEDDPMFMEKALSQIHHQINSNQKALDLFQQKYKDCLNREISNINHSSLTTASLCYSENFKDHQIESVHDFLNIGMLSKYDEILFDPNFDCQNSEDTIIQTFKNKNLECRNLTYPDLNIELSDENISDALILKCNDIKKRCEHQESLTSIESYSKKFEPFYEHAIELIDGECSQSGVQARFFSQPGTFNTQTYHSQVTDLVYSAMMQAYPNQEKCRQPIYNIQKKKENRPHFMYESVYTHAQFFKKSTTPYFESYKINSGNGDSLLPPKLQEACEQAILKCKSNQ